MLAVIVLLDVARWQQALYDKETGNDRPIVLRYYGDQQLEEQSRHKRRVIRSSLPSGAQLISQGCLPVVPRMFPATQGRVLFMVSVSDGSSTVLYPFWQSSCPATGGNTQITCFNISYPNLDVPKIYL